jgi:hypothetical protein
MSQYTPMQVNAARALNKIQSDVCNVNEEDQWKYHGEFFLEDAKVALDAAAAPELLEALKDMLSNCQDEERDDFIVQAVKNARAAIQKATGEPT